MARERVQIKSPSVLVHTLGQMNVPSAGKGFYPMQVRIELTAKPHWRLVLTQQAFRQLRQDYRKAFGPREGSFRLGMLRLTHCKVVRGKFVIFFQHTRTTFDSLGTIGRTQTLREFVEMTGVRW